MSENAKCLVPSFFGFNKLLDQHLSTPSLLRGITCKGEYANDLFDFKDPLQHRIDWTPRSWRSLQTNARRICSVPPSANFHSAQVDCEGERKLGFEDGTVDSGSAIRPDSESLLLICFACYCVAMLRAVMGMTSACTHRDLITLQLRILKP